jgi:hypothetical protein
VCYDSTLNAMRMLLIRATIEGVQLIPSDPLDAHVTPLNSTRLCAPLGSSTVVAVHLLADRSA